MLVDVSQRLVERTKIFGSSLLSWFPSVLRHMLQTRLIGQSQSPLLKKNDRHIDEAETERERDSVLRVMVMLEIFNQCLERLYSEDIPNASQSRHADPSKKRHTISVSSKLVQSSPRFNEILRSRLILAEMERISNSAMDLVKQLEEEVKDLDAYWKRLESERSLYSPTFSPSGGEISDIFSSTHPQKHSNNTEKRSSYGHSLLDSSIPSLPSIYSSENTPRDPDSCYSSSITQKASGIPGLELLTSPHRVRRPHRPDLAWAERVLTPAIHTRTRQRAHSFPYALGLLARCVISGTMKPRPRLRGRARSLDDTLTPGVASSVNFSRKVPSESIF